MASEGMDFSEWRRQRSAQCRAVGCDLYLSHGWLACRRCGTTLREPRLRRYPFRRIIWRYRARKRTAWEYTMRKPS